MSDRQWVGKRSQTQQINLRLDALTVAEFDRLCARQRISRVEAFRFLLGLTRHGFNPGLVRAVNGRCNAIRLRSATLKARAQPGSQAMRELIELDEAARDISALMVPIDTAEEGAA